MKLTWYGHSCFKLESEDGSIVFDPYAPGTVPGWKLPEIRADAVICSHEHADHNYASGITLTGNRYRGKMTFVPSFHDKENGALRGKNTITVLETGGLRAVHMGDIGCTLDERQIATIGKADLLMIPVGGHYTVGPDEAMEIARALSAAIIVPMHYRGKGFGYDVIGPVLPFLKLAGNIRYIDGNCCEPTLADAPATIVFRL